MNLTELARILKVSPQELKDTLPKIGFDIGQKAIKIDKKQADKIIKEWRFLVRQLRIREQRAREEKEAEEIKNKPKQKIQIPAFISVRDLSKITSLPISKILGELIKNGIFASMNERIDFETALIIGEDLGLEVELQEKNDEIEDKKENNKLSKILESEKEENLEIRPPVIVIMGHVDHGKTSLLDVIRKTNITEDEAGGITQHIGAYQIHKNNRLITFIDTPGHEAFTAMRSRGAKVADIAILVVAADDGVKPQTIEAFRIIEAAKIPFLVAINKIDKSNADINRVKQELSSQLNILPEDWGGKIICSEISARDNLGIEELLDMVLLTSDTESQNIKANKDAKAAGTVVESHIDKGAGPLATIIIQNGTLKIGDTLCFNNVIYGKVKALKNYKDENVVCALPSMPVKILGLKLAPEVGDVLEVGIGEKIKIKKIKNKQDLSSFSAQEENDENDEITKLNIILKSDVLVSLEAVEESLIKINTEDVKIKVIHKSLGNINEGDLKRAEDTNSQIIGFNVVISPKIENIIRDSQLKVKTFKIIYDLIEYAKQEMELILKPQIEKIKIGTVKVLAVFRNENKGQIIGGKITEGKIVLNAKVDIIQNNEFGAHGVVDKIQLGKEEMKEMGAPNECGLKVLSKPIIKEGDILEVFQEKTIVRKLD